MEENLNTEMEPSNLSSKKNSVSEIESIQLELSELVKNINNFIINETKNEMSETVNYEYTNDNNIEEKEDSSAEKHAGDEPTNNTAIELCNSNAETEIAEVDWSVAAPVIQKYVADLEQLHTLNVATSSLIQRVKELAVKKSIDILSDNQEEAK